MDQNNGGKMAFFIALMAQQLNEPMEQKNGD